MFLFSYLMLNHFHFEKKSNEELIYKEEKNQNINAVKLYFGTKIKNISSHKAEQNYRFIQNLRYGTI